MRSEFPNFTQTKLKSIPRVNGLLTRLKEIGEKAEYLQKKSELIVDENRSLREETRRLKDELKFKDSEMRVLKEQYEVLKMAKSLGSGTDENTELKKRINEYIREIDQCLKLIGD